MESYGSYNDYVRVVICLLANEASVTQGYSMKPLPFPTYLKFYNCLVI